MINNKKIIPNFTSRETLEDEKRIRLFLSSTL